MMKLRNRQKGFTLIELLIVIAIIGIIAALLIPNFIDALQKAKQKRTMSEMRNTGSAWMAWLSDQAGAAAAAGADTYTLPSATTDRDTIAGYLVPRYIQTVPDEDAWNNAYTYYREADADLFRVDNVMAIWSMGRQTGSAPTGPVDFQSFDPTDYDQDILWGDGYFVWFPEGQGGAAAGGGGAPPA